MIFYGEYHQRWGILRGYLIAYNSKISGNNRAVLLHSIIFYRYTSIISSSSSKMSINFALEFFSGIIMIWCSIAMQRSASDQIRLHRIPSHCRAFFCLAAVIARQYQRILFQDYGIQWDNLYNFSLPPPPPPVRLARYVWTHPSALVYFFVTVKSYLFPI